MEMQLIQSSCDDIADGRVDLSDIRKEIERALGENSIQKYFEYLRRYSCAKLSKAELDSFVHVVFGADNVHLHNRFVGGIVANAHSKSMPLSERLFHSTISPSSTGTVAYGSSGPPRADFPRKSVKLEIDYASQSLELPTLSHLRYRMVKTAAEVGIRDVSENCGKIMAGALEYHLKDVLSHVVRILRVNRSKKRDEDGKNIITMRDLKTAVEISPYLLGEELPVSQERISALQTCYTRSWKSILKTEPTTSMEFVN